MIETWPRCNFEIWPFCGFLEGHHPQTIAQKPVFKSERPGPPLNCMAPCTELTLKEGWIDIYKTKIN